MKRFFLQLRDGILQNNPTFVQLLGMCPTLAVTTTLSSALGMGLATTLVLLCSNLLISLLRKWIVREVRIAAYIVVIAGFVTAIDMLFAAFLPSLSATLGVFIPLIVANCIILARAEAYASKHPPLAALTDGLAMGLGFTLALALIGAVRELFGSGTLLGVAVLGTAYQPMLFFVMPCGAFVTLGCILGVTNYVRAKYEARQHRKAQQARWKEGA